jgi:hypothetical protein
VAVSDIVEADGELHEINPGMLPKKLDKYRATMAEKEQFLAELKCYSEERGYKPGWASNKFRDKFDCWPDWSIKHVPPAKFVSIVTAAWIKKTQDAWRRAQRRSEAHV